MMTLSFLVLCTIASVHANSDSVPGMCLQCRAILVSSYSVRLVVCLAVCERQLGKDMFVRVLSMHCFGLHACILCMDACSGGLHTPLLRLLQHACSGILRNANINNFVTT